jgi:hypothetical protein
MVVGPVIDPKGLRAGEINKQASDWIEARMEEIV